MKRIYSFTLLLFSFISTLLAEDITVYFVNTEGWSLVKAYVWPTGGSGLVGWPGEDMKLEDFDIYGKKVYSYTFDYSKATNIIFNNGSSGDKNQTEDLIVDKDNVYYCKHYWYSDKESIPILLDFNINGIFYNLDTGNKTAEVTYRGTTSSAYSNEYSGSVTIPETITHNSETYSVTSIGDEAFRECSGLTSVTIPNSVTSIGSSAFYGTGIYNNNSNWDNGVLYIDNCLIKAKSDVVKGSYTIKKGTRIIGEDAFSFCSELTSVTIPNSVTSIGSSAFSDCSGLTSVTIGESVTSIGDYAFSSCSGLTSVTIGESVTSIGDYAFSSCSGLTEVTIPNSVTSIGDWAFSYCSGLTEVTIPNGVMSIGDWTFSYCSGLTSVTIPNSVTSIGQYVFEDCSGFTKVNYLGTVDEWMEFDWHYSNSNPTSYGKDLYINNELLTDVKITTADSIKNYAFYNCKSIKSVEIGNNVTTIGSLAFSGCSGLTSVTIPNSVTSIGTRAFDNCSGLAEVTIPNSVTSIDLYAFSGCSGLTSVIWNAKNCEDFKYDSSYMKYTSPFYNIRSSITSFTFGNEVEHIPAYLCYYMNNLKEVTIGESVTSIGSVAFSGCSGLTSVIWNAKNYKDFKDYDETPFYNIRSSITSFTFGNEVEHIPAYLCSNMKNLKEVTIGKSATSIGYEAFYNCSGLTKVNYLGTVEKWVEFDWDYADSNPTYYAEDLYINNELITDVKITSADSIKDYAFYNCKSIKSAEIGNSVTSIGDDAFYGCNGLTSVIWNAKDCEDFSSSKYSPFYDTSSSITSFTFGNEVEHIPAYLCYGMSKLTEMTIPNSVTSIGKGAFSYCSGLTKVNYLGTVDKWVEIDFKSSYSNPTYYAKDLYINNELLTDVKITTADSIKDYAFYNCQSIKSVEIGNCVTSIGSSAFYGCSGLTSVSIGESVTSIGSSAFSGCDKLRKVTAYPTTVPNAYESSFAHYNAYLYVPCDVYEDYDLDDVFGNFKYIKCIAAEEVDAPEKVEIEVDEDNNANVIWPSTDGAKKYELEISKDGEVFCTLVFNENGQLTSIDFGNRSASVGFQFTVTGLDGASKYAYSMVAMDKKGNELQSYKGTFTTNGYVPGPGEEDEPVSITETLADANITVSGGTISADADFSIYNTIGHDVTAFNGSLQPGVYLVSIENNIVKVMVK